VLFPAFVELDGEDFYPVFSGLESQPAERPPVSFAVADLQFRVRLESFRGSPGDGVVVALELLLGAVGVRFGTENGTGKDGHKQGGKSAHGTCVPVSGWVGTHTNSLIGVGSSTIGCGRPVWSLNVSVASMPSWWEMVASNA